MTTDAGPVRIALVGLGATGLEIGRALLARRDCRLVAAVERDPAAVGTDLGALLGTAALGVTVVDDVAHQSVAAADVAIVATTPRLAVLRPIVLALVGAGVHVVSICEELGDPRRAQPQLARELDEAARRASVAILGTGANPGMIMDVLPLVLSAMTQRVRRVEVQRGADLSQYGDIVRTFGLGMTPEEFAEAQVSGAVAGHTGFHESISLLAAGLGWDLDTIEVDPVGPAFLAEEDRHGAHMTVPAGAVAAVSHGGRGVRDGQVVIDLRSHFGFLAPGDPLEHGDRCRIEGDDQVIEVTAPAGYSSMGSTVAVVANVVAAVPGLDPGLRTMADVRVRDLASKGAWSST